MLQETLLFRGIKPFYELNLMNLRLGPRGKWMNVEWRWRAIQSSVKRGVQFQTSRNHHLEMIHALFSAKVIFQQLFNERKPAHIPDFVTHVFFN